MLLVVGWKVVSELVKNPITAEQILLQLLGNAITKRDLLINTFSAFSGRGARSGWCHVGRSADKTPGACWKKEAAKIPKTKLNFRNGYCSFFRQKTLSLDQNYCVWYHLNFSLKHFECILISFVAPFGCQQQVKWFSPLCCQKWWDGRGILSQHKWIDMLTQQSYFHGGFNPIKPSVVVMEVFWFVFSEGLHFCLFYALFSRKVFIPFTWDALQTQVIAATFSTSLELQSLVA